MEPDKKITYTPPVDPYYAFDENQHAFNTSHLERSRPPESPTLVEGLIKAILGLAEFFLPLRNLGSSDFSWRFSWRWWWVLGSIAFWVVFFGFR